MSLEVTNYSIKNTTNILTQLMMMSEDMNLPSAPSCPYLHGNTLNVQIDATEDLPVTIIETFEPFTLSCALLVELDWPSLKLKGRYVLKLFDRRFATQLRRDSGAEIWTPEIEENYRDFVSSGDLEGLLAFIKEKEKDYDWAAEYQKDWSKAQLEVYLQYWARQLYQTETAVYDRIHELQGQDVPRFIARVVIRNASDPTDQHPDCLGILLEYIEGFTLTDLEESAPKEAWQHICEEAIRIINRIGSLEIRNEDVKTRSFKIQANKDTDTFKVVMMDFATCVLRHPDQDDKDWRYWRAAEDEEGAIGLVMQSKLKGGFKYTPSAVSESLSYEFMREDSIPYAPNDTW